MQEPTELDNEAESWFNDKLLAKLRFEQDYYIFPGKSEPMIKDGKKVGLNIQRPDIRLYATGITKLYQLLVLGETWEDVVYTKEEEARFEDNWVERWGLDTGEEEDE